VLPNAPNPEQFEANVGTRGFMTAHSSDESYHVEGVVNIPLVQNRLALRVVGYKDDIAGYVDNVSPAQAAVDYSGALGLPDGTLVTPATPAFTHKDINSEGHVGCAHFPAVARNGPPAFRSRLHVQMCSSTASRMPIRRWVSTSSGARSISSRQAVR
jgi:hypothetical protein